MVLLCRELGSFLSRINRYAFISGGQHRKLRHTGYSYFMQTWIQTTLSGQECTLERLACFSTPLFFFNRGSKHNFVTYISRCERNEERNVISSFFLYKIPLRNDRFLRPIPFSKKTENRIFFPLRNLSCQSKLTKYD